jgi:hypothetical protein
MISRILFLFFACISFQTIAQDLDGEWELDKLISDGNLVYLRGDYELFARGLNEFSPEISARTTPERNSESLKYNYFELQQTNIKIQGGFWTYINFDKPAILNESYRLDVRHKRYSNSNDSVIGHFSFKNNELKVWHFKKKEYHAVYKRKTIRKPSAITLPALYQRVYSSEKDYYDHDFETSSMIKIFEDSSMVNFFTNILSDTTLSSTAKNTIADSLFNLKTKRQLTEPLFKIEVSEGMYIVRRIVKDNESDFEEEVSWLEFKNNSLYVYRQLNRYGKTIINDKLVFGENYDTGVEVDIYIKISASGEGIKD